MSKGTYDVQKGEACEGQRARGDSSYRSFLCAILIFFILCMIIILVGNWNSISGKKEKKKNRNYEEFLEFNQNEDAEFVQKGATTESQLHATKSNYVQSRENNTGTTKTPHSEQNKVQTTENPTTVYHKHTTESAVQKLTTGRSEVGKLTTRDAESTTEKKVEESTSKIELIVITKSTEGTTTVKETDKIDATKEDVFKSTTTVSDKVIIVGKDDESYLETTTSTDGFDEGIKSGNVLETKENDKDKEDESGLETTTTDDFSKEKEESNIRATTLINNIKEGFKENEDGNIFETTTLAEIMDGSTESEDGVSLGRTIIKNVNSEANIETTTEEFITDSTKLNEDSNSNKNSTTANEDKTLFTTATANEDGTLEETTAIANTNEASSILEETTTTVNKEGTPLIFKETTKTANKDGKSFIFEDTTTTEIDSTTTEILEYSTTEKNKNVNGGLMIGTSDIIDTTTTTDDLSTTTEAFEIGGDNNEFTTETTTEGSEDLTTITTESVFEETTTEENVESTSNGGITDEISTTEYVYSEETTQQDSTTVYSEETTLLDQDSTTVYSEETTLQNQDSTTVYSEETTLLDQDSTTVYSEETTLLDQDSTTVYSEKTTLVDQDSTTEMEDFTTETASQPVALIGESLFEEILTTTEISDDRKRKITEETENTEGNVSETTEVFQNELIDESTTEETETSTKAAANKKKKLKSSPESKTTTESALNNQLTTEAVQNRNTEKLCETRSCKSTALSMLSLMNEIKDPCEDFYRFSCGYKKYHHNKIDDRIWDGLMRQTTLINDSSMPHLVTFRKFYDSCVDFHYTYSYEARIEKVKAILKSYGMESFQAAKVCDIDMIFKKLLSLNSMYFMEVGVDVSDDDEERVLQLGPSLESSGEIGPWSALAANQRRCLAEQRHKIYGPGNLNLAEIYGSYAECLDEHKEFRQLLHDAIKAFGYDKNEGINQHFTINYINKLLSIRPNRTEIYEAKVNSLYTKTTVGQLHNDFPNVNWTDIFSIVQKDPVSREQRVNVYFKDYIADWFNIFSNIKEKKWLLINLIITDLYYNFVVHKVDGDVQNHCLKMTSTYLNDIASNLFVNNFPDAFLEKQEIRVNNVFRVLRSKLHDALEKSTEFSELTPLSEQMRVSFSSKREIADDLDLVAKYDDFGRFPSYQEYLLRAKEFKMRNMDAAFGGKMSAFDKKAVTYYQKNKIYVPLGMVVDVPLNLPDHVTFARIGIKLAQAISKHFDPTAVDLTRPELSDLQSSYLNFISDTDSFLPTIENKLDGFEAKVNHIATRNERISDNAALRLVTDAHVGFDEKTVLPWISGGYNKDKVVMITVAQEFCDIMDPLDYMVRLYEGGEMPGAVRVYNMFMNSEAFVNVFGCVRGSGMNENPMKSQFPHSETFDGNDLEISTN